MPSVFSYEVREPAGVTAVLTAELKRCRRIINGLHGAVCNAQMDAEAFELNELAKARYSLSEYESHVAAQAEADYWRLIASRYLAECKQRGVPWHAFTDGEAV